MPACTIHLLHLSTGLPHFLDQLSASLQDKPIVVSRVIRWIIRPTSIDVSLLLDHPWDLLIVLPGTNALPAPLRSARLVRRIYTLQAGIPSVLLKGFSEKNAKLLAPNENDIPALTGSLENPRIAATSQNLEMSPDLKAWFPTWEANGSPSGRGAVSMLNLLTFKAGMHEEYLKYGKAFGESIGKRRGGTAKLVGKVIGDGSSKREWDEIALAHYPSIRHFADMAASEDYQAVNHRHRIPSLQDTCILMTSELDIVEYGGAKSKL